MKRQYGLLILMLLLSACDRSAPVVALDDDFVTIYSIKKVDPAHNFGHQWLALNPTTYRISNSNEVVSKTAHFLNKHSDCVVLTKSDWECRYSQAAGFGMRDGKYWEEPEQTDVKFVSRFEHLKLRCEWQLKETNPNPTSSELAECMAAL